jgi:sialidase-1
MLLSILLILFVSVKLSFESDIIIFKSGEAGYSCIRIPAILTTAKNTLLAFGEGRMNSCADNSKKDIVYKRSVDNGQTWSNLQILYGGNSTNSSHSGDRNVIPIQLKYNQRILVPFCRNNLSIMQTYSDDDGLTFSSPQIIPNVVKSEWQTIALGPPGGILLQSNRILVAAHYSLNKTAGGAFSTSYVMLNDHNGQFDKWYLGGQYNLEDFYPNEGQAVELLPNANSIFINSRSYSTVRIGAYSNDGGITFNKVKVLNTLVQPLHGCEGSTIYHQNTRQLFYTGPANISMRNNLSLYTSKDNGENWTFIKMIWEGPAAYSSLIILNDQSIGALYEAGAISPYEFVIFTTYNL